VEDKEGPMSNPFLARTERPTTMRTDPGYYYDDDDENDANDDDDDDDDIAATRSERWLSCSGFGSPEWWSRH
jgi:hypothetical protein